MNINELDNRTAMGLNKGYSASVKDNIQHLYDECRALNQKQLLYIIDNNQNLLLRYAASQILALLGDPRINTIEPIMIDIPASEVNIGIHENDIDNVLKIFPNIGLQREWILKETPKFTTKINTFRIAKYLITNQEFKDFLISSQYEELPTSWEFGIYPEHKSNHPVYTVSYNAALEYTKWLSTETNRNFRLPTEYEWEYVASGSKHQEFPWGGNFNKQYTNTLEMQFYTSTPVGIFYEGNSRFGACDLAGNVEEYVSDDFRPYTGSKFTTDDIIDKLKTYKVCRGGSFTRYGDLARCSRRHGAYPKDIYVIGFRLAESCNYLE